MRFAPGAKRGQNSFTITTSSLLCFILAEDHSAVAPTFLGLIQGFIGTLDDALDVFVQWLVLQLGYSNAESDGKWFIVSPDAQGCNIRANTLRDGKRLLRTGSRTFVG